MKKYMKRCVAAALAAAVAIPTVLGGITAKAADGTVINEDVGQGLGAMRAKTYNAGKDKLEDEFGVTNEDILDLLHKHINDKFYLGTSYQGTGASEFGWYQPELDDDIPKVTKYAGGTDWRSPNGDVTDTNGFPGKDDVKGQAAMNCTGFVWDVIMRAQNGGADHVSNEKKSKAKSEVPCFGSVGAGRWMDFLRAKNVEYRTYATENWAGKADNAALKAFMKAVVADGYIAPGDIIWAWDGNVDWSDGIGDRGEGESRHVGIYIGGIWDKEEVLGGDNGKYFRKCGDIQWWHSSYRNKSTAPGRIGAYNAVNMVTPKDDMCCMTVIKFSDKGQVNLKKVSANPSISDDNNCYSLKGAVYGVYSDAKCTKKAGELKTNAEGESNTLDVTPGNYWVKEITAPKGFEMDSQPYPVEVTAGKTATVSVRDEPGNDPVGIELMKIDKDTGKAVAQGAASLAGAQFTVKYYDGYYTKDTLPQTAKRTWVLETKEEKKAEDIIYRTFLRDDYKVSGDDFYYEAGVVVLPYGTISIEETKAPVGYRLKDSYLQSADGGGRVEGVYVSQIKDRDDGIHLVGGNVYTMSDSVIRGGVKIQKRDLQSGDAYPEGGASLKGAEFDIINANSSAVVVDGKSCDPGRVAKTIVTDEKGIAQTTADCLPYGNYKISESGAPEGYLKKGAAERTFSISKDGEIVSLTDQEHSIFNQVKRGDLEFVKIEGKTHKRMVNIPFRITSKTTGESHIAVTDDNGCFSSESSVNEHSSNTNANDGHTEDEQYDSSAGIWFGLDEAGENVAVDDELGALPYDTYTVEELSCKANEKHELVPAFEIKVSADKRVVKLGTITDEIPDLPEEVQIHTTAANQTDGSKTVKADGKVTIVDTVALKGLEVGKTYKLTGWQMVKAENAELLVDGKRVENDVEFVADKKDKKVEVVFTFDASELGGSDLVTFEELYDITDPENPEKEAEHKDIEDEGQTVHVEKPEITIHTTAVNKADGSKTVKADGKATITDKVALNGLETGRKYQLKGWQMLKDKNAELKIDGKRIENTVEFTADQKDKEVSVEFTFDASELGGSDLVTFEELYDITDPENPEKKAEHKDIGDEGQTVFVSKQEIKIHTNATNKADGSKKIQAGGKVTVVDTVTLEGLEIGKEYKLSGWQMVKAENAELKVDGKRIESDLTFTADKKDMEVQIEFTFNASGLGGKDLVTFEELYDMTEPEKPEKVAVHKDIEDEGQTVSVEKPKKETPSKPKTPREVIKTGDTQNILLWALLMGAAVLAGAVTYRKRKTSSAAGDNVTNKQSDGR